MVLKANDRRTSSPCHDEFRGPRSDCVRQSRVTNVGIDSKRVRGNDWHRLKGSRPRFLDLSGDICRTHEGRYARLTFNSPYNQITSTIVVLFRAEIDS
ncbi:hypothetical protein TNCV_274331 [Trichonephila clavipes]|nr:hypothetical protein TNCV_274331 [Trichonephila clavipes]